MSDNESESALTKAKRPRTDAQIAAFEKAKAARQANLEIKKDAATAKVKAYNTAVEKKLALQAIKEKLNGEPISKKYNNKFKEENTDPDSPLPSEDEEPEPAPVVKKAPPAVKKSAKVKKEPKIIYESATESESEPEVIVVKKKKSKAKKSKTIVVQESDSEEEEAPVPVQRATKSQQHKATARLAPAPRVEPPKMQYYFA